MFVLMRWTVIVIWSAILVGAVSVFALAAGMGLTWTDAAYLLVAALAVRELRDWLD